MSDYSTYTNRHNTVASWFLGPRAENFKYLDDLFKTALATQFEGRQEYFPEDNHFITDDIQNSDQFKESIAQLKRVVKEISKSLTKHSVPFWNPRYNGHMLMDTTLPGIAGYITTMIFNPNNVAAEASPLTTTLERKAGQQLCEMIGIDSEKGWGHITCGGSIANLESIWAARNMKFYPLSLTLATENDGPLSFIRGAFKVTTCDGTTKPFDELTTWELLNLTPETVLDIPDRLYKQFLISPTFLQQVMRNYVIQTVPKDDPAYVSRFEKDGIQLSNIGLITSATKHYSWPKGAAITGIGSTNIIDVEVDFDARMKVDKLRETLEKCLKAKRAVYAVVAIMGSTEHGACDPLKEIVELRTEFQRKGLSFALHADGAWGTYYHTMLNPPTDYWVKPVHNTKFDPLSLTFATENGPFGFIRNTFKVTTCDGTTKLFADLTTWELLNLTPDTIIDIPNRLKDEFSIEPTHLQEVIQSISRDNPAYVKRFEEDGIRLSNIDIITGANKDYLWAKGAAINEIGSKNIIDVEVDLDSNARMKVDKLRTALEKCLEAKHAVYAVIVILGSIKHDASDPLKEIVELRTEFQRKGLSFALYVDGVWGIDRHTILNPPMSKTDHRANNGYVPSLPLKPSTADGLLHLRYCETITVDPHKSGYIQYPAGGLLYRDGRMRYLVTWTSPVVFREGEESIGVYGVEGSKPGASPAAVWLSNRVIGLEQYGYGALLGEGIFGAVKMYSHLSTMSTPSTDFRVAPLNMLPAEASGGDVEAQKEFIRNRILNVPNLALVGDKDAMALVKQMGSDLSINAFAVNFRANGEINKDIVEANNLNMRIFERLAITSINDDINTRPLILTSTQLAQSAYTTCLTKFKERLGLVGNQDLYTLINVVSSPFPTEGNFTAKIAAALRQVIEQEVVISQFRNTIAPTFHGFIMQGLKRVHYVHLPMFNMADHRYQLVITGDLPPEVLKKYADARKEHPGQFFTLANASPAKLMEMVKAGQFEAVIDIGMPPSDGSHFISGFSLTNVRVVVNKQLDSKYLTSYPKSTLPFYLYGSAEADEWHIDHALLASPNSQLNSDCVKLISDLRSSNLTSLLPTTDSKAHTEDPVVVMHVHLPEASMQPFPSNADIASIASTFFFRPGAELKITITRTVDKPEDILGTGTIQLSDTVFIDTDMLNMNPVPEHHHEVTPPSTEPSGKSRTIEWDSQKKTSESIPRTIEKGESGVEKKKKEQIGIVKPVLHSAFEFYTGNKTKTSHSLPLLRNVQPSLGEAYYAKIEAAFDKESFDA